VNGIEEVSKVLRRIVMRTSFSNALLGRRETEVMDLAAAKGCTLHKKRVDQKV